MGLPERGLDSRTETPRSGGGHRVVTDFVRPFRNALDACLPLTNALVNCLLSLTPGDVAFEVFRHMPDKVSFAVVTMLCVWSRC